MYKNLSPISQLFLAGLIVVATSIFVMIIGAAIAYPLFGFNYFTDASMLSASNMENIGIVKYFQIVNSLGMFVIPPFIIAKLYSDNLGNYLAINSIPKLNSAIITGAAMIVALPIIAYSAEINSYLVFPDSLQFILDWMKAMENTALEITVSLLKMDTPVEFLVNLLMIGIIPAVGEELLFRGVIQKILGKWLKSHHIAILLTAFIFSAFHLQFLSFLPRFLLGIYLGYLLVWTGNIWLPIIAHFVNNASAVTYYYFADIDIAQEMNNASANEFPIYVVIISALIFGLLAWKIKSNTKEQKLLL